MILIILIGCGNTIYYMVLFNPDPIIFDLEFDMKKSELYEYYSDWFEKYGGITREMIDKINELSKQEKKDLALIKIKIFENQLYLDDYSDGHYRVGHITSLLTNLMWRKRLPNIEFLFTLHDEAPTNPKYFPFPFFVFNGIKTEPPNKYITFPDLYSINVWNQRVMRTVFKANKKIKWESKKEKMFWRGVSSGTPSLQEDETTEDILRLARFNLVNKSLQLPHILDAKFTAYIQSIFFILFCSFFKTLFLFSSK